jgi:hypothetical protein
MSTHPSQPDPYGDTMVSIRCARAIAFTHYLRALTAAEREPDPRRRVQGLAEARRHLAAIGTATRPER